MLEYGVEVCGAGSFHVPIRETEPAEIGMQLAGPGKVLLPCESQCAVMNRQAIDRETAIASHDRDGRPIGGDVSIQEIAEIGIGQLVGVRRHGSIFISRAHEKSRVAKVGGQFLVMGKRLVALQVFHGSAIGYGYLYGKFAVVILGIHQKYKINLPEIVKTAAQWVFAWAVSGWQEQGGHDGNAGDDDEDFYQSHRSFGVAGGKPGHDKGSITRLLANEMFVWTHTIEERGQIAAINGDCRLPSG